MTKSVTWHQVITKISLVRVFAEYSMGNDDPYFIHVAKEYLSNWEDVQAA